MIIWLNNEGEKPEPELKPEPVQDPESDEYSRLQISYTDHDTATWFGYLFHASFTNLVAFNYA